MKAGFPLSYHRKGYFFDRALQVSNRCITASPSSSSRGGVRVAPELRILPTFPLPTVREAHLALVEV